MLGSIIAVIFIGVMVLLPFGLIFVAYEANRRATERRNLAWGRVAHRMGLSSAKDRVWGALRGQQVDMRIEMRSAGKSQVAYTVITSTARVPLDLGLALSPQGAIDEMKRALFGSQDIVVGDPVFDKAVVVKADDPERARALLSSNSLRAAVLQAGHATAFHVTDNGVWLEQRGAITDERWLAWALDRAAQIAETLERVRKRVPAAACLATHSDAWARFAAAQGLASSRTPLAMWGELDGIRVTAYAARTGPHEYALDVRVDFSTPLGLGIYLRPLRWVDGLAGLFGPVDQKLGDALFDKTFLVQAAEPGRLPSVLDEQMRKNLLDLNHRVGPITARDHGLSVRSAWLSRHPSDVLWLINQLRDVGQRLADNAHGKDHALGPYR